MTSDFEEAGKWLSRSPEFSHLVGRDGSENTVCMGIILSQGTPNFSVHTLVYLQFLEANRVDVQFLWKVLMAHMSLVQFDEEDHMNPLNRQYQPNR